LLPRDGNIYEVIDGHVSVIYGNELSHLTAVCSLAQLLSLFAWKSDLDISFGPLAFRFADDCEVQPEFRNKSIRCGQRRGGERRALPAVTYFSADPSIDLRVEYRADMYADADTRWLCTLFAGRRCPCGRHRLLILRQSTRKVTIA
jgi:hypothetical protein